MQESFSRVEGELNSVFVEREDEIRSMMLGLVSRQHMVMIGLPGTGKSALAEKLAEAINTGGTNFFHWMLTKYTTPEELFGPVSMIEFAQDRYVRKTEGKLPEAEVAFLDEVFKANSAILNSLLSIMNERQFSNGNPTPDPVPLEMVIGASNEAPEDESLAAFYDRFALRHYVEPIKERSAFAAIIGRNVHHLKVSTISREELEEAQSESDDVTMGEEVVKDMIDLREKLKEENIQHSDRRWQWVATIMQANAWLDERDEIDGDDLYRAWPCLWNEPQQIPQVKSLCMSYANPFDGKTADILKIAKDIFESLPLGVSEDPKTDETFLANGTEAFAKLKRLTDELKDLHEQAAKGKDKKVSRGREKSIEKISSAIEQTHSWRELVLKNLVGA
jgi:MoxR-like ATPase